MLFITGLMFLVFLALWAIIFRKRPWALIFSGAACAIISIHEINSYLNYHDELALAIFFGIQAAICLVGGAVLLLVPPQKVKK